MDLPRTLSLVNYAVNGVGLGHVSRLVAINRWLRRYGTFAGVRTQHWFLTTSEADTMLFAEGFAAFKLPSKSIVEELGIPKLAYLALAKQWVWNSVALLRPDLLVVDTFPAGSFDELPGVLNLCRHKALVLRRVKPEFRDRPGFQALLGLYDRIVVPEHEGAEDDGLAALAARRDHVRWVGPIVMTERFEALSRREARARLGVADDAFCLLVSGGGGGDDGVAPLIDRVREAVGEDPRVHLVVAAGPLYRGESRRGPRVTWWTEPGLAQTFAGVDGAVSAAGFNATHELLHFGVPTVFVPQRKIADDQHARVAALVAAGAALEASLDGSLPAALARLRDETTRARLRAAAQARVPHNYARDAAAALLGLVLPASVVRQAREVVDDGLLAETRLRGVALGDLVDVALGLLGTRQSVDRAALELEGARELLEVAMRAGMPSRLAVRLAGVLGRKLCAPHAAPEDVGEAAARLISHPAASGQWSALLSLLELLGSERDVEPIRAVEPIAAVLEASAARGMDLFGVVEQVTRLRAREDAMPNRVLLERARAQLAPGGLPS